MDDIIWAAKHVLMGFVLLILTAAVTALLAALILAVTAFIVR